MRRTAPIAALGQEQVTSALLDVWAARKDPTGVPVAYAIPVGVAPVGHCVRFWRQEDTLWAEMEIRDVFTLWPETGSGMHCECLAGEFRTEVRILVVLATTMSRGAVARLFAKGQRLLDQRRN